MSPSGSEVGIGRAFDGPILMAEGFAPEFSQWGTQTGAENSGVWQTSTAHDAADCL